MISIATGRVSVSLITKKTSVFLCILFPRLLWPRESMRPNFKERWKNVPFDRFQYSCEIYSFSMICRAVGCRVICFLLIITVIILVNITRVWSNYIYCPTSSFTATIPHLTSASQRRILMSVLWIRNLLLTISIIHNCPIAVARLGDK